MKKTFTKNITVLRSAMLTCIAAGSLLLTSVSYGQTYYSKFPVPAGHYSNYDPKSCDAPAIQNIQGIASKGDSSYASIKDTGLTAKYNCTDRYSFNVDLNMAGGPNAVQPGNQAGFKIRVKPGITRDSLGYFLTVSTYLRDSLNPNNVSFQEYATGGGSSGNLFYGINLDNSLSNSGSNWFVYFTATLPFNLLELDIDPKIIAVDTTFEFDAFYAFGGAIQQVLPATIANFKASVSDNKNVNLSWQSLTETNVSAYRIERSNNGGTTYAVVASVAAKGNSNVALSYSYTDKVALNGNYLYRIVTVNKDGTTKATGSVAASISGIAKLLLYPTIVKAGQNVTVKTSENGLVTILLYDVQGRLVKQQRTTSAGELTIATSGLSSGMYNVKVITASGAILQSKIVVE